jgi:penicillin-binding protein 1B
MMAQLPQHGFSPVMPDGVQYRWVNAREQALTGERCEDARLVPFIAGSEPRQRLDCEGQFGRQIRSWFEGLFR